MRSGRRIEFLWTRETIIYAIDLWHREHLQTPTIEEWTRAGETHPSYVTVMRHFGSWNTAIRAAGFRPRSPSIARDQTPRPKPSPTRDRA